jgi:hypothetical protein
MSNKYIATIKSGSNNRGWRKPKWLSDLEKGLGQGASGLLSNVQESTGFTQKRVKNISDKTESNMVLAEDVLTRLDTTLNIYNVTGVILGITGVVVTAKMIKDWKR